MLFERDKVANKWTEYIRELYDDEQRGEAESVMDLEGPDFIISEVQEAIKRLKKGKLLA